VTESDGIKNFVSTFDSSAHGFNKKTRGRPKRVDVFYDDLRDPEHLEDHLVLPSGHGMTFNELIQEEANETNAAEGNNQHTFENYQPTGVFIKH
jgi:hypothetical protein